MRLVSLSKVVLLVLSTSCIANAYLTPGQVQSQTQQGPRYQPGHGGGQGGYDDCSDADGCWVDPGSGSPYDPGPYDPQPGHPGYPGHGGPGHGYPPPPPPPPGYPHEPPPYPGNPGYPGQPGYGRQQISLNIYRTVYGNDRIDLTTYFNLSSYRGWSIEQVIVNGRSLNYDSGALSLIINGNNYGQATFSGGYTQQQSIWLSRRPMIGAGADSIVLYTSGQLSVDNVTLIISR